MNFLSQLIDKMPQIVNKEKCSAQIRKKYNLIAFILAKSSEGKQNFLNISTIPQQILIKIMSFTCRNTIFFTKQVLSNTKEISLTQNDKILILKQINKNNYSSIKVEENPKISISSPNNSSFNSKNLERKKSLGIYKINIIKSWVIRRSEKENTLNDLIRQSKYLNAFFSKLKIIDNYQANIINFLKSKKKSHSDELACHAICQNRNLLIHEVECLKSYESEKMADSNSIENVINLIKKNLILLTVEYSGKKSKKSLKLLVVDDSQISMAKNQSFRNQKQEIKKCDQNHKQSQFGNKRLDLNSSPVRFDKQRQCWVISQDFERYQLVNEIDSAQSRTICDSENQFMYEGLQFMQVN